VQCLTTSYEFRTRLPDGRWRWLASRSALVNDEQGRPVRRVGVNWDVTEAKQAELVRQQAVLAEREIHAKSQFLSRMSHELRTPLNAVLGFTQLLQIEARRSADAAQLAKLGHIRAAGDHLLSLINDVLDLSSLESGALKLALGPVDLGLLVRQSVPLVESLAAQHGVVVEIAEARGAAQGDATRLRQVLINLLSNAIKYNRRGGRVVVHAVPAGEKAILRVRDTGRGLTPIQLAGLFEPFNRFGAESEGIEGTGIGLTIVKALVEGMGGSVAVSSTPGEGTLFEVTLATPTGGLDAAGVAEAADSAQAPWSEPRRERGRPDPLHRGQPGQRAAGRGAGEDRLRPGDHLGGDRACRAWRGAQALLPDLVLIDLQLPDFDGFEVLRRLRAEASTAAIPCVALSANAMPEDIERGLAAGFADYWTKPIDFAAFLTALKKRFPASAVGVERQS
jgi:signal transduction histidine kinase